jgi:hypothetical protein
VGVLAMKESTACERVMTMAQKDRVCATMIVLLLDLKMTSFGKH